MTSTTCRAGRELLRRSRLSPPAYPTISTCQRSPRWQSSTRQGQVGPANILARPTWSVRSLLLAEGKHTDPAEGRISPKQLHHLLRLSALPLPKTPGEETKMINVLQSQLLFVRDIQSVDTEGVEPLRSIRDETEAGLSEATIGVEQLQQALSQEVAFGRSRRPRRQRQAERAAPEVEGWNPLQTASQTMGPYFVVRSGKTEAE